MRPFLVHLGLLIGAGGLGFGFRLLVFIGFLGFVFAVFTHSLGSCDCEVCVRTGVVFSEVLSTFCPVSVDGPVGSDVEVEYCHFLYFKWGWESHFYPRVDWDNNNRGTWTVAIPLILRLVVVSERLSFPVWSN